MSVPLLWNLIGNDPLNIKSNRTPLIFDFLKKLINKSVI